MCICSKYAWNLRQINYANDLPIEFLQWVRISSVVLYNFSKVYILHKFKIFYKRMIYDEFFFLKTNNAMVMKHIFNKLRVSGENVP